MPKKYLDITGLAYFLSKLRLTFAALSHTHSADSITDGTANKAYTAAEKTKLSGISDGANNYSHPASHAPAIISQDANNRFVTDAEKAAWNAKQAALGYTPVNKSGDTMTGTLTGPSVALDARCGKANAKALYTHSGDVSNDYGAQIQHYKSTTEVAKLLVNRNNALGQRVQLQDENNTTWSLYGEHNPPSAGAITAGGFAGQVSANAAAQASLSVAQLRNIYAGTSDMTAGSTALASGTIYLCYE